MSIPVRLGLLVTAVAAMTLISVLMLRYVFTHLVSAPAGAVDLKYYYTWVHRWFEGQSIYDLPNPPEYPPASLVLLWPLVGWMSLVQARWFFAAAAAAGLTALTVLAVRDSGARGFLPRAFVALMVVSMTPTGAAVGNGQLIVLLLPILLIALRLLQKSPASPLRDFAAGILLLASLAKPSLSLPFFWLAVLVPFRLRPVVGVSVAYVVVTCVAMSFQAAPWPALLRAPVVNGSATAIAVPDVNLHFLLRLLGLRQWILPASAAVLLGLGVWLCRHRHQPLWLLLAVTALVARLWTYHRVYDSMLIILADIALFRIATSGDARSRARLAARILLGMNVLVFLSPGRGGVLPVPINYMVDAIQGGTVVINLIFMLYYSRWHQGTFDTVPHRTRGALHGVVRTIPSQ